MTRLLPDVFFLGFFLGFLGFWGLEIYSCFSSQMNQVFFVYFLRENSEKCEARKPHRIQITKKGLPPLSPESKPAT